MHSGKAQTAASMIYNFGLKRSSTPNMGAGNPFQALKNKEIQLKMLKKKRSEKKFSRVRSNKSYQSISSGRRSPMALKEEPIRASYVDYMEGGAGLGKDNQTIPFMKKVKNGEAVYEIAREKNLLKYSSRPQT